MILGLIAVSRKKEIVCNKATNKKQVAFICTYDNSRLNPNDDAGRYLLYWYLRNEELFLFEDNLYRKCTYAMQLK